MPPFPWSNCTQYTVSEPYSATNPIKLCSRASVRRRRRHAIISQKESHYFAGLHCAQDSIEVHSRCQRGVRYSTLGRYFDLNLLFVPQTLVMQFVVFTEVLTLCTYSLPERQYYWTDGRLVCRYSHSPVDKEAFFRMQNFKSYRKGV